MSAWADWNGTQRRWTMPTGSILQFCHCKNEEDVFNYQSLQFDIILPDEATQLTRFIYRYLISRNRATKSGITPFMAMATNPGGPGHQFFKAEFVDCGPPEQVHSVEVEEGVFEDHIFIPAFLADNEILEKRDPMYRKKLESQPEIYRKQLLEGDWDSFAGQYYPEFNRKIHTRPPFEIPKWWKRFRSLDYGLDMTACYWWATSTDGKCYITRELHQPGLRLSAAAQKIVAMTPKNEKIAYTVASPDLWNRRQETGTSGRELMAREGLFLTRAKHDRIAGWRTLREYLAPYEDEFGVLTARLQIFDHCTNLIRCLPQLLHDEHNPEDAAENPHNITHGPESIRYGIMSRPSRSVDDSLKFDANMPESARKAVVVNLEFERKYREELVQHRVRW
jgi:phage terminase large subunit